MLNLWRFRRIWNTSKHSHRAGSIRSLMLRGWGECMTYWCARRLKVLNQSIQNHSSYGRTTEEKNRKLIICKLLLSSACMRLRIKRGLISDYNGQHDKNKVFYNTSAISSAKLKIVFKYWTDGPLFLGCLPSARHHILLCSSLGSLMNQRHDQLTIHDSTFAWHQLIKMFTCGYRCCGSCR